MEKAFDNKDICFIYDPITGLLKLKVLNSSRLNACRIYPGSGTERRTFADINMSPLSLPPTADTDGIARRSYRRILSTHAKNAHARALRRGWIANAEELHNYYAVSEIGLAEHPCMLLTWQELCPDMMQPFA